jgi:hypothetical protein
MKTISIDCPFVIEGVDENDGSRTELESFETSYQARDWLRNYTRRLDDDGACGGWHLIEVYDTRNEDEPERIAFWAKNDD